MSKIMVCESWSSGNQVGLRNSNGDVVVSDDIGVLLAFLRYKGSDVMRVTFDLDAFIAPVIRKLSLDILQRLADREKGLSYHGHELYYYPERMLRIGGNSRYGGAKFYGLLEFWKDPPSDKPSMEQIQGFTANLMPTLGQLGMSPVVKLTSPVAVFQSTDWGRRVFAGIPSRADIPGEQHELLEYASKADKKEWVSNHQVGHFEQGVFDYDVQSSYPGLASQLPDTNDLTFWKSAKLGERERSALLGVVKGRFTLNPDAEYAHCSPIRSAVSVLPDALPGNPLGKLDTDCYCLDEVRFVEDNGIGTFKMVDGWFGEALTGVEPRLPFKDVMDTLFGMRSISPLAQTISKRTAVSIVGKLIETHEDGSYVPYCNDLYHATILARARVQVAQFLIDNAVKEDELLCVQTDGVKVLKDIPLTANGMGSWVNKGSSPVLVVSPYKVYTGDKRPYQMTYAALMDEISKNPSAQSYGTTNPRHITLKQAIRDLGDISRVGEVVNRHTSIDLITLEVEQNRDFGKLPRTGKELLNSQCQSKPVVSGDNRILLPSR